MWHRAHSCHIMQKERSIPLHLTISYRRGKQKKLMSKKKELLIWHPFGLFESAKIRKFQKQDKQTQLILLIHFIQFGMFHSFLRFKRVNTCSFFFSVSLPLLFLLLNADHRPRKKSKAQGEDFFCRKRKSRARNSFLALTLAAQERNETC